MQYLPAGGLGDEVQAGGLGVLLAAEPVVGRQIPGLGGWRGLRMAHNTE